MNNLLKYPFLVILMVMVFSCQNRPSEVLSRKKMESLMYDMYIAEAIIDNDYQEFAEPEKKEALIDQVLRKHKITAARWDTSLSWYSDNIDLYLQLNDSVKERLIRNKNAIEEASRKLSAQNASDEVKPVYYIPPHFRIASLGCDRGFKFRIDSLRLAEKFAEKDTIFFRFKTLGVYPLDRFSLKSMLKIDYKDTTVYEVSKLNENKLYSFPLLRSIDEDTVVSVNGFVNLSGKLPETPIQLYEISLEAEENNIDSINFSEQIDIRENMLEQKPQSIVE